ncbi:hypothetical protein LCGC14_0396910 [marine sediment metagenome]|uniref:Uncharacterized protein n=1 Tax=marine sediment metagenome TaxID=412755 RepID=A0A0F9W6S2_9ZZZZ
MTHQCTITINGVTVKAHGDKGHGAAWSSQRGWHDCGVPVPCPDHGTSTMAYYDDGSSLCGTCYMQRGRDLGVI